MHRSSSSATYSKPVDYFRPLTVDVSVEYELPKEVAPPPGSAPLLIIHPSAYYRKQAQLHSSLLSPSVPRYGTSSFPSSASPLQPSSYYLRSANLPQQGQPLLYQSSSSRRGSSASTSLCRDRNCDQCYNLSSSSPQKSLGGGKRLRREGGGGGTELLQPLNLTAQNNSSLYLRQGPGLFQMINSVVREQERLKEGPKGSGSDSGVCSENESDSISPIHHHNNNQAGRKGLNGQHVGGVAGCYCCCCPPSAALKKSSSKSTSSSSTLSSSGRSTRSKQALFQAQGQVRTEVMPMEEGSPYNARKHSWFPPTPADFGRWFQV